jgi:hypothetical protein
MKRLKARNARAVRRRAQVQPWRAGASLVVFQSQTELTTSSKRAEGEPEDTAKTNACDTLQLIWSSATAQRLARSTAGAIATRPLASHLPCRCEQPCASGSQRQERCQCCDRTCRPEECSRSGASRVFPSLDTAGQTQSLKSCWAPIAWAVCHECIHSFVLAAEFSGNKA